MRPHLDRPNLTVVTDALVQRLLMDGTQCTGVQYTTAAGVQQAHANREVVLSPGTIGSAQLLLLSGIGPAAHLRELGIDALAVVDPKLRVHDITGLRVADASIMPVVPSTNINAAVIAVAERAADLIRQTSAN